MDHEERHKGNAPVIATKALRFSFAEGIHIADGIDLKVPAGSVFGVLGPNGAGKSTLLKLVLGLIRVQGGKVELLGRPLEDISGADWNRVGALIEEAQLYAHLSGLENLRVMATYRGMPEERIDEALELTGLTAAAGRLVRNYSTGMKQRLGIAMALLPDPELLIFDEPTNGLDPQGIVEVRRLIRRLHQRGDKTILLSSHLLHEVEQVCTHLCILQGGRLHYQGAWDELRSASRQGLKVRLESTPLPLTLDLLRSGSLVFEALDGGQVRVWLEKKEDIPGLIDRLRGGGVAVYQVVTEEDRLEAHFLRLLS